MRELVSIIIPVYNAGPYLEDCLLSAISQSYQHLEIIVINDGSTDSSKQVMDRYAASDSRIRLYCQENQGLGYTRNRGISLSGGKYIFFLDADDTLPKNAIRALLTAVRTKDADYAVGKVLRFNAERMYVPVRHLEFKLYEKPGLTTLAETPELLQDSIACNKLWKKSLIIDHALSFKEGKYYEDLTFTMKAAVLAKNIQVINEVVYHWRVREDKGQPSITQQQMKLDNTRHRLEALIENRKWLLDSEVQKKIVEEHDLKSLLDVLRLHVIKFSLIGEEEKTEWWEMLKSFLEIIPAETSKKLPDKEKFMYKLLKEGNGEDLNLFTEMLMSTEKTAVVQQELQRFVLKGIYKDYDVTSYLKPTMIVEHVTDQGMLWRLQGRLKVPKASHLPEGKFYMVDRITKQEIVLGALQLKQIAASSSYPYEDLYFIALLDTKVLITFRRETAYDLYYRLTAYPQTEPTRVRILSSAMEEKKEVRMRSYTLSLYRTQYGNLSVVFLKKLIKHAIKEKMTLFWKRKG